MQVLSTFLKAGVPIAKLKHFRDILEGGAFRLTDTTHMLDLLPFVLGQEKTKIKEEISGKHVSLVFDGTTRLGEVLVVILRFIVDWKLEQRLVRLKFLRNTMKGEEVARELISIVSVDMGVPSNLLIGCMRDRASVNNVAMNTVSIVYSTLLDIGCYSHTLDRIGEKFATPTLDTFSSLWISLFSHSPKAKARWRELTGKSVVSFSKTRWWSRWEVMHQLFLFFGDVHPFLTTNTDIGPSLRTKMLEILNDGQKSALLQTELAAVIDLGEKFVKATYTLEGDGVLVTDCYEVINELRAAIHVAHYPNVRAIATKIRPLDVTNQQQLFTYAMSCLKPGIDYFEAKFADDTKCPLSAFGLARVRINVIQISEG